MTARNLVLLLAASAAFSSSASATFITRFWYKGLQNVWPLYDSSRHELFYVGSFQEDEDLATQRCANICSVYSWCGAFYLYWDDGMCHIVPQDESGDESLQIYHHIGPGHAMFFKHKLEPDVLLPTDPALIN